MRVHSIYVCVAAHGNGASIECGWLVGWSPRVCLSVEMSADTLGMAAWSLL